MKLPLLSGKLVLKALERLGLSKFTEKVVT
jgi:hypothetical protein